MSTSSPSSSKEITVSLEDGSTIAYTLRGLKEEEVEQWASFCASVFSYKANPPSSSYFARHYWNDPHRNAGLIRVAVCNNKFVASCRVFVRTISLADQGSAKAGGIGEVCTDAGHRRRGLSKLLLKDAIDIMEASQEIKVSLLHAAPEFFPVYQSSGYQCSTSRWSTVKVSQGHRTSSAIRLAKFPDDTSRLMKLHQKFTQQRFLGSIVRTEDYWNNYLSKELEGSLYVKTNSLGIITAWLSLRPRGEGKYQMREFGCAQGESYAPALQALLRQATQDKSFTLHLPTFVLDEIRQRQDATNTITPCIDWKTQKDEDDLGWMYRSIGSNTIQVPTLNQTHPHLIWPSDSF